MAKKKNFAIIGASNFSASVLSTLVNNRQQVTVFDIDGSRLDLLLAEYDTVDGIILDSTNKVSLAKNGINQYDGVIVGFGSNIETSMITVLNLLDLKCNKIIVKARDNRHKRILQALGINDNQIITPDNISGKIAGARATYEIDADIEVQSIDDEYISTSLVVKSDAVIGKTLKEAGLTTTKDFNIIQIKRKGRILIPDNYTLLKEEDFVVLFAKPSVINNLAFKIQGEAPKESTIRLDATSPTINVDN